MAFHYIVVAYANANLAEYHLQTKALLFPQLLEGISSVLRLSRGFARNNSSILAFLEFLFIVLSSTAL